MIDVLTFARLADDCYSPAATSAALRGEWLVKDLIENDNFLARAYARKNGRLAVVAFRGTVPTSWEDWVVANFGGIGLSLNSMALKLNTAVDFTGKIKSLYGDVWLTGHSLGGAYVQLVAAICEVPGMTFNAPGVLNLINQMSPGLARRLIGAVGGGAMSLLTGGVLTGSGGVSDYFNRAAAANNDAAFPMLSNWRGNLDPISLIGAHAGGPLQTIDCLDNQPDVHAMARIIRTLEARGR